MDDIDAEDWEVFFRIVSQIMSCNAEKVQSKQRDTLLSIAAEYDCEDDMRDLLALGDPSL